MGFYDISIKPAVGLNGPQSFKRWCALVIIWFCTYHIENNSVDAGHFGILHVVIIWFCTYHIENNSVDAGHFGILHVVIIWFCTYHIENNSVDAGHFGILHVVIIWFCTYHIENNSVDAGHFGILHDTIQVLIVNDVGVRILNALHEYSNCIQWQHSMLVLLPKTCLNNKNVNVNRYFFNSKAIMKESCNFGSGSYLHMANARCQHWSCGYT